MAPKHFKGGKKNQKYEEISSEMKGAGSTATSCWGVASTIYNVLQDTSENKEKTIRIWTNMLQLKSVKRLLYWNKYHDKMLMDC